MSTYEAQSWQVPARPTSWEQAVPPSKAGMSGSNGHWKSRADRNPGMTPAVQREEVPAFGMQVEGMWDHFINRIGTSSGDGSNAKMLANPRMADTGVDGADRLTFLPRFQKLIALSTIYTRVASFLIACHPDGTQCR